MSHYDELVARMTLIARPVAHINCENCQAGERDMSGHSIQCEFLTGTLSVMLADMWREGFSYGETKVGKRRQDY